MAHVQEAIEHIFPLLYEFRKERPPKPVAPVAVDSALADEAGAAASSADDDDEDSPDEVDSDDNITREGRLKEESFWSDEEEYNKTLVNGRRPGGALARKRRFEGKSSTSTKPRKIGRFAKSKPFRRRRPLGKAANDPSEDVMVVSELEDEPDDF